MKLHTIAAVLVFLLLPICADGESKKLDETAPAKEEEKIAKPVTKSGQISIAGKLVPYTSTAGKMVIRDEKGKAKASIFYVSYTRSPVKDAKTRPVMFAFNGGPGSSSVWLHLGMLGPQRIDFPGDGTEPITPPARLIENESSILDVCDLVFIDPVSTGYSRADKDADEADFHGLESDISSVADFIRMWITENKRWSSPKYLCGESYGGMRAAGLSDFLQNRYGMSLNGVVILSGLLDFRTLISSEGSQLSHQIYLPTFATIALFHKKIQGDREEILKQARDFAYGEYGAALLKGNEISEEEVDAVAEKLAALTGISAEIWKRKHLRLGPSEFSAELLRNERKVIGRFDARVAWDATSGDAREADYDPSYSLALGAFSTTMLAYLGDELGWKEDQPYEILTGVGPWKYGSDNRIVNVADRLANALRDNPKLRVLVMGAHADLATPPEGMSYSLRQIVGFPPALRRNIEFTYYEAGHMFYLNPPDLMKARADLVKFIETR